jgi:hypothetical protein
LLPFCASDVDRSALMGSMVGQGMLGHFDPVAVSMGHDERAFRTGAVPSSVVAAAVDGDMVAFTRIVQAHHDDMARVCRVVCGDVELAQDATQAAWAIAWRRLHTLRDQDKLRSRLVSIAVNEARKPARRRRIDRIVDLEARALSNCP